MPLLARAGPVLLGAFIVWQLLFLLTANATRYLRSRLAGEQVLDASPVLSGVEDAANLYAACTGQEQSWSLFAPMVQTRALFVAVRVDTPDGACVTPSVLEPVVPGRYFHPPGSGDRLWHAEKELTWPFVAWDPVEVDKRPAEWRAYIHGRILGRWRNYRAYLRWQQRRWQKAHPGDPEPTAFTVLAIVYSPSSGPEKPARREVILEVVRWRPGAQPPAGCLPLEMRDGDRWTFLTEHPPGDAP